MFTQNVEPSYFKKVSYYSSENCLVASAKCSLEIRQTALQQPLPALDAHDSHFPEWVAIESVFRIRKIMKGIIIQVEQAKSILYQHDVMHFSHSSCAPHSFYKPILQKD